MDNQGAGSSKRKQIKKRCVWSAPQIDLLLELWEEKVGDLRGTRKNSHVFEEMRHSFEEHGYIVSADEIKIRINNLTARYRKEKAAVGPSGGSPSEWQLYTRVNRILGSFRIHNVSSVVEDSIEDDNLVEEFLEEDTIEDVSATQITSVASDSQMIPAEMASPSGSERPSKIRKTMKPHAELVEEFKRTNARIEIELQHMREVDEKLLEVERERNYILRDMTNSSKELNEALVQFLTK